MDALHVLGGLIFVAVLAGVYFWRKGVESKSLAAEAVAAQAKAVADKAQADAVEASRK